MVLSSEKEAQQGKLASFMYLEYIMCETFVKYLVSNVFLQIRSCWKSTRGITELK